MQRVIFQIFLYHQLCSWLILQHWVVRQTSKWQGNNVQETHIQFSPQVWDYPADIAEEKSLCNECLWIHSHIMLLHNLANKYMRVPFKIFTFLKSNMAAVGLVWKLIASVTGEGFVSKWVQSWSVYSFQCQHFCLTSFHFFKIISG